jgi:hypothetical protein
MNTGHEKIKMSTKQKFEPPSYIIHYPLIRTSPLFSCNLLTRFDPHCRYTVQLKLLVWNLVLQLTITRLKLYGVTCFAQAL